MGTRGSSNGAGAFVGGSVGRTFGLEGDIDKVAKGEETWSREAAVGVPVYEVDEGDMEVVLLSEL